MTYRVMRDVIIMMEQTSELELRDLEAQLPTDLHLVEYTLGDEFYVDGVRAHTKVDIFDFYYDFLKEEGLPFQIKSIRSGYGKIKPELFKGNPED